AVMAGGAYAPAPYQPPVPRLSGTHALPGARAAGLENGVADQTLFMTTLEGRKRRYPLGTVSDEGIDIREQVVRTLGVSLRMAAWIVREGPCLRFHQQRVFDHAFVRSVAAADPQQIRLFLIPHQGAVLIVRLEVQTVLAASRNLTDHAGPRRSAPRAEQDGRAVLIGHRDVSVDVVRQDHLGRALHRRPRLLARLVDNAQIRHHLDDGIAGDELHGIEPVAANVADRSRLTTGGDVDTPVVVRLFDQPVPQV